MMRKVHRRVLLLILHLRLNLDRAVFRDEEKTKLEQGVRFFWVVKKSALVAVESRVIFI